MRSSITRFYFEEHLNFEKFLGSNLSFILLISTIFIVPLVIYARTISAFWNIPEKLFIFSVFTALLMIPFVDYTSYLIAAKKSGLYARYNIFFQSGTAFLSLLVIYLLPKDKFYGRAYVQLTIAAILALYISYHWYKKIEWSFDLKYIKKSLIFSAPLILHSLSGYILVSFDQLIINQLEGSVSTGQYIFAYQIGMLMNIYVTSTNKSWLPSLYNNLKDKNFSRIRGLTQKYSKQTIVIAVGLILFSKEIALILARKNYYDALNIIPWVVFGYLFLFMYNLYSQYAFYHKNTTVIALITFFASFTNITLNYWLIPIYGYKAAAATTLASYFLLFFLHYLHTSIRFKNDRPVSLRTFLPDLGVPLLAWGVVYYLNVSHLGYILQISAKILLLAMTFVYIALYFNRHREQI